MKHNLYQIDTFTDTISGVNPAIFLPLEDCLSDDILLKKSNENAVAETTFSLTNPRKSNYDSLYLKLKWICVDMPHLQLLIA